MNARIYLTSLFLTCFFITLLSSCTTVKSIEYNNLDNFKVEKINLSSTVLSAQLNCYNPNNFGIELINSNFDIYLNDKLCGSSIQEEKINIKKKSSFAAPLKIDLNLKKTIANLGLGLLNQEVKITIKGIVKVKKGILVKNLPVNYSTSQKLGIL